MGHEYSSRSYVKFHSELDDACEWLKQKGIAYSVTRVGKYKSILSHLCDCITDGDPTKFYQRFTLQELVNASHETAELIRIHEGMAELNDAALNERLKKVLKGKELYSEDNEGSSGRDFGLELQIAAKFVRKKIKVDFDDNADAKVIFSNRDLYLECKRLRSRNKIEDRIKEGLGQLSNRYRTSKEPEAARGILVLSIGKLVNAELELLDAKDNFELSDKASAYNKRFIEIYKHDWLIGVNPQTLGVMIVLDTPGAVKKENQLITCHEITFNNCVPIHSVDHALFIAIAQGVFGYSL